MMTTLAYPVQPERGAGLGMTSNLPKSLLAVPTNTIAKPARSCRENRGLLISLYLLASCMAMSYSHHASCSSRSPSRLLLAASAFCLPTLFVQ
jgi:hypothetical protein